MSNRLILLPDYPAPLDDAWMTFLPYSIILEADHAQIGPLTVSMTYPHAYQSERGMLNTAAWIADYDARNGRVMGILFPGWREEEIFDEVRAALQAIRLFSESPSSGAPRYFGIMIAAKCLVDYFDAKEPELRKAMSFPFTPMVV